MRVSLAAHFSSGDPALSFLLQAWTLIVSEVNSNEQTKLGPTAKAGTAKAKLL
jgi:hypothetical protein